MKLQNTQDYEDKEYCIFIQVLFTQRKKQKLLANDKIFSILEFIKVSSILEKKFGEYI